jgi:hypothetical protein
MNLYLDDDIADHRLAALLRRAAHGVLLPADAGTAGASDARHLARAVEAGFVLLTRNHDDFLDLHLLVRRVAGVHSGILAVRYDNDRSRDMKLPDIVRAIGNLEA